MFAFRQMKLSPRSLVSPPASASSIVSEVPYSRPRRRMRWRRLIFHESLDPGPGVERVAWMRAADVRADRAAGSAGVELVVAEVVRGGEARVVGVGRERERRAARPAPDHLRGEPEPRRRVARAVGAPRHPVEEAPEPGYVLPQLPDDEVAAVAPQVGAAGALGVARQHPPGSAARRASGRSVYWPYSFG